jgi:broad specificity phosphatase PhoE
MSSPIANGTKTVYLIRHAESDENRRLASLSRCFKSLGKFSLPSKKDLAASTELLNVSAQVNSNVSGIGEKQIDQMAKKLEEADFLKSTGVKLVAHSPLLRARQTSDGMLGCMAPDKKTELVDRVLEIDMLAEKTPQEWVPGYFDQFKKRIANFENWLTDQPEEKVAIVGHSQYFKAMLGLDFKFGNCDVWQVTFTGSKIVSDPLVPSATVVSVEASVPAEKSGEKQSLDKCDWIMPPQWTDLKQLYKCEVAGSKKE